MQFSIITASYNPGGKLWTTINSILNQNFQDYEIVIKDGGSKDQSIERLQEREEVKRAVADGKITFLICPDKGVYDGMNQALSVCRGDYVLFLNCGDIFHDSGVLRRTAEEIDGRGASTVEGNANTAGRNVGAVGGNTNASEKNGKDYAIKAGQEGKKAEQENIKANWESITEQKAQSRGMTIFYGNTFCMRTGAAVHSSPKITGFTCYRNIPCHQSCFYDRRLFREKKYDICLEVRADYDHFLWCYYKGKAAFHYMDFIVADYEGSGISESAENRKQDKAEHEMVIKRYMAPKEILEYKGIMLLTLAPLRRWIAESSPLSKVYHRVKMMLYRKR